MRSERNNSAPTKIRAVSLSGTLIGASSGSPIMNSVSSLFRSPLNSNDTPTCSPDLPCPLFLDTGNPVLSALCCLSLALLLFQIIFFIATPGAVFFL